MTGIKPFIPPRSRLRKKLQSIAMFLSRMMHQFLDLWFGGGLKLWRAVTIDLGFSRVALCESRVALCEWRFQCCWGYLDPNFKYSGFGFLYSLSNDLSMMVLPLRNANHFLKMDRSLENLDRLEVQTGCPRRLWWGCQFGFKITSWGSRGWIGYPKSFKIATTECNFDLRWIYESLGWWCPSWERSGHVWGGCHCRKRSTADWQHETCPWSKSVGVETSTQTKAEWQTCERWCRETPTS